MHMIMPIIMPMITTVAILAQALLRSGGCCPWSVGLISTTCSSEPNVRLLGARAGQRGDPGQEDVQYVLVRHEAVTAS